MMLSGRQKRALSVIILKNRFRRRRRWGVNPIFRNRCKFGAFAHLFKELKSSPEDFFRFLRMTRDSFDQLVKLITPFLQKHSRREFISVSERLVITLRYLASGDMQVSLSYMFRVGRSTITMIIRETCDALYKVLQPEFLPSPEHLDWKSIQRAFETRWQFDNCLGALDGKHVYIKAPPNSGSQFFNYKKNFSIVLMAVCDSDCKFTMIDVGAAGSEGDGGIFRRSIIQNAMQKIASKIPPKNGLPSVFVADEAFPLNEFIMRPFPRKQLDSQKRIFNYRLSRARRTIENSFGILRARWQIFRGPINAMPDLVTKIIKACCCLHNYLKDDDKQYCLTAFQGYEVDGSYVPGQWTEMAHGSDGQMVSLKRTGANNAKKSAIQTRQQFCNLFNSADGSVPWQADYA